MNKLTKVALSSTLFTMITGATYALYEPNIVEAEDVPPIVLQVENHEERITDLEDKTDKTQTQVNQNSSDISSLQGGTQISPTEPVPEVKTPVNRPSNPDYTPPTPKPTPEPEPVIDPNTIVDVTITEKPTGWHCRYYLHNGNSKGVYHGETVPCYEVGTILPKWLQPK